jgi:hypothetical protein
MTEYAAHMLRTYTGSIDIYGGNGKRALPPIVGSRLIGSIEVINRAVHMPRRFRDRGSGIRPDCAPLSGLRVFNARANCRMYSPMYKTQLNYKREQIRSQLKRQKEIKKRSSCLGSIGTYSLKRLKPSRKLKSDQFCSHM